MWNCDRCKQEYIPHDPPVYELICIRTDARYWICKACEKDLDNFLGFKEEVEPFETHMPKYDSNGQPW